eukprot:1179282-Prorocentrum_minimum.AAC.3
MYVDKKHQQARIERHNRDYVPARDAGTLNTPKATHNDGTSYNKLSRARSTRRVIHCRQVAHNTALSIPRVSQCLRNTVVPSVGCIVHVERLVDLALTFDLAVAHMRIASVHKLKHGRHGTPE